MDTMDCVIESFNFCVHLRTKIEQWQDRQEEYTTTTVTFDWDKNIRMKKENSKC